MTAGACIRKFSSIAALAACASAFGAAGAQQRAPAKSYATPYKDPVLATVLSVLVPGGGQLYAERWGKGIGLFGGTAAFVGIAIDASNSHCTVGNTCNTHAVETGAIIAGALLWGYGWATAGRDARLRNNQMLNNGSSFAPFLDRRNGQLLAGLALRTR
jgi:hypothetical protein